MDLAYLRTHPENLPAFLTHQRIRETPVTGGDSCMARRLTLDDGASVFVKSWPERSGRPAPEGFFSAEAAGLNWLRDAGAPVPEVVAALPALLALQWIEPGRPSATGAERLGRDLAAVHGAPVTAFGATWTGYIGTLPLDNTLSPGPWGAWYAERRLLPYLRRAADSGALTIADVALVERLISRIDRYGDAPPARLHGDLWPGNVLWDTGASAWLVDPAAHGGHPESDLAQLALFGGAPYLDRLLAAYQEVRPLDPGWRARVPLHQLHLLLVHAALFGGAYAAAVRAAADAALRA